MKILINVLANNQNLIKLEIDPSSKIMAIKKRIEEEEDIPFEQQILLFKDDNKKGVLMENDTNLIDYNVNDMDIIYLVFRIKKKDIKFNYNEHYNLVYDYLINNYGIGGRTKTTTLYDDLRTNLNLNNKESDTNIGRIIKNTFNNIKLKKFSENLGYYYEIIKN